VDRTGTYSRGRGVYRRAWRPLLHVTGSRFPDVLGRGEEGSRELAASTLQFPACENRAARKYSRLSSH